MKTVYLGDGLYARYDGYDFALMANSATAPTDTIYLEPDTLEAFLNFVKACKGDGEDED